MISYGPAFDIRGKYEVKFLKPTEKKKTPTYFT
jgi:hypothetical protein